MRKSLLIAVLAWSSASQADEAGSASVTRAIRAVIDGSQSWMTSGKPDWYDRLAGVKLAGPSGELVESRGDLDRQFAMCPVAETTWKLGAISLGVDAKRGFAWFQAPVVVDETCATAGFAAPSASETLRASGILVVEKSTWRLVALALSRQLPDARLFQLATALPARGEPNLDDTPAAIAAASWFTPGGFARGKWQGDAVASGTDPGEMGTGAAALRLASAWDSIHLRAQSIAATTFAGGRIALVRADVRLPVKAKAAAMTLYAIAVVDDTTKTWRWTSLQFTSELAPLPQLVYPDTSGMECPHGKC